MLRRQQILGLAIAATAVVAWGCQFVPGTGAAGELSMKVQWPMRVQTIPEGTAVVAVAVFRDGRLIERQPFRIGIIGQGSGSMVYGGLTNGSYQVVAAAFDKDLKPLAGGSGSGTVDLKVAQSSQVPIELTTAGAGAAGQFGPYTDDIRRYLGIPIPSATPSAVPTTVPTPTSPVPTAQVTPPPPSPTAVTTAVPTATPTNAPTQAPAPVSGGTNGGGALPPPITFTGGFQ